MRRPGQLIQKDPNSVEPQGFDWTLYLADLGDEVVATGSTWAVTGPDSALTLSDDELLDGGLLTKVVLTGGTLGARYTVTNRITTNGSPAVTDDRSFQVLIQER